MSAVYSYRDLDVWKNGRLLVVSVYQLTEGFPKKETYGLASQMQRAAVSIPSNIAEGHSRRGTKDYMQFISIAIGSLAELDTQLYVAEDLGYVLQEQAERTRQDIVTLQKMLHGLKSSLACKLEEAAYA